MKARLAVVILLASCSQTPADRLASLGIGSQALTATSGVISVDLVGTRGATCGLPCSNAFTACVTIDLGTGQASINHDNDANPADAYISGLCPSDCPTSSTWSVSVAGTHLSADCSGDPLPSALASCVDIPDNGSAGAFTLHEGLNTEKILCNISESAKGFTGEVCTTDGTPGATPVCVSQACPAASVPYGGAQFCCRAPGVVTNFETFPDGENCFVGGAAAPVTDICSISGIAGICQCPSFGSVDEGCVP